MSFAIFDYANVLDEVAEGVDPITVKIQRLADAIGDKAFPIYVRRYIAASSPFGDASVAIYKSSEISGKDSDVGNISRRKGLMGKSQLEAIDSPSDPPLEDF